MAASEVTGWTSSKLDKVKESYEGDKPFHMTRCLARIGKQPPSYDGPQRYCALQRDLSPRGDTVRCKYHTGAGQANPQNLDKLAAMKHGMQTTRENLIEDFDEKDQALYDWIMSEWPTAYGIDLDEDPQAEYDFHRLATEVVRAERGRGYLIEEGEVSEQDRISEDGSVVIDQHGEVVTEKSEHYLAQMLHRQDNKISSIEKELGISRKERLRRDSTDDAVEAIKGFAELGAAFLDRESEDYDPGDTPWEHES